MRSALPQFLVIPVVDYKSAVSRPYYLMWLMTGGPEGYLSVLQYQIDGLIVTFANFNSVLFESFLREVSPPIVFFYRYAGYGEIDTLFFRRTTTRVTEHLKYLVKTSCLISGYYHVNGEVRFKNLDSMVSMV